MAGNLFKKAAAYRKKHPNVSQARAVQIVAKKDKPARKKKSAAVGKVHRKKKAHKKSSTATRSVPRKIKVKVRAGKKGGFNFGISGVSTDKIKHELAYQQSLRSALERLKQSLKRPDLHYSEKIRIKGDMKKYGRAIATSKKHVTALKRHI